MILREFELGSYSPIAQADTDYVIGCTASGIMRVTAETSAGAVVNPYFPASQLITKGKDIRFGIELPYMPKLLFKRSELDLWVRLYETKSREQP